MLCVNNKGTKNQRVATSAKKIWAFLERPTLNPSKNFPRHKQSSRSSLQLFQNAKNRIFDFSTTPNMQYNACVNLKSLPTCIILHVVLSSIHPAAVSTVVFLHGAHPPTPTLVCNVYANKGLTAIWRASLC
jgi:hypothetical protein